MTHPIAIALGGRATLHRSPDTDSEMKALVTEGLPVAVLEGLGRRYGLSRESIARSAGIAQRTLARRLKEGRLKPAESDLLARLARVLARAEDVLGTPEKAGRWMTRPNQALGGAVPLEETRTDIGTDGVWQLLGRIEHGVYS